MNAKDIADYIVRRRRTLDVSQTRVAELSGVSVHTLSNLETATGNVTLSTLLKVCDILGLDVRVGV